MNKNVYFCVELSRICRLENSSNFIKIPRQVLIVNGGPQPSGMLSTADYKHGNALKS
jgi:hypothetical protein